MLLVAPSNIEMGGEGALSLTRWLFGMGVYFANTGMELPVS